MGIKKSRYRTKISWECAPLPLTTHALLQREVQQKKQRSARFCSLRRLIRGLSGAFREGSGSDRKVVEERTSQALIITPAAAQSIWSGNSEFI
jgi:hypothetical protein